MLMFIVLISVVILSAGYFFYGRYLGRRIDLDDSYITPATSMNDGVDFVPTKVSLLLGQHFSAIAAAGPIVGPILAGIWFGWVPAIIWILLGAIFIGGVHDFTALIASVRHKSSSIGELVKQYMSRRSYVLFLIFVWFALVYVIIAFTDITAQTFKAVSLDTAFGPGVAASSFLYLGLGIFLGISLYKLKMNLWIATSIFIPLVILVIWFGISLPQSAVELISKITLKQWEILLLVYCFIASLLPVWLLLQPRGYLGGWFLYLTIFICLAGVLLGGFDIKYPAFNIEGLKSITNAKLIFPILFITVACGACSGFHGIVSSGTTSKQLFKESDSKIVGYGAMLLEALVAVLALCAVMILAKGDSLLTTDPNFIYANAIARYLDLFGISFNFALAFALLAFSTFVYDTLDVSTRLARYILQELLGLKTKIGAVIATFMTLLLPIIFLMLTKEKSYLVAWPIFGTSNQLLASLTLLVITVWLIKSGKNALFTILPLIFMLIITICSLILQILPFLKSLSQIIQGGCVKPEIIISGMCGIILFILSIWLIYEAINVILSCRRKRIPSVS